LRGGLLVTAIAIGLLPTYRFIGSMIWFKEYLAITSSSGVSVRRRSNRSTPIWFPYPPTGLMLVRPFGLLPFWPSLFAWGLAGAAAISLATRRILTPNAIAIGFVTAAGAGVLLGARSACSSALWLLPVSVQPIRVGASSARDRCGDQAAVRCSQRDCAHRRTYWRAIGWQLSPAVRCCCFPWRCFGFDTWERWATNLHKFPTYLTSRGIDLKDVGMYGLVRSMGLPGWTFAFGIPLGIATSWLVFGATRRRSIAMPPSSARPVLMSPTPWATISLGLPSSVSRCCSTRAVALMWLAAALIVSAVFSMSALS